MTERRPFFSVLIPTTGRADLIRMAVQSVLAQTFNDFELIVADSSNEDAAREATCSSRDPRVRYEVSPTASLATWDFAVKLAKGSYIIWLDDDNYFLPNALKTFKAEIEKTNADIVTATHVYYYDKTHPRHYLRNSLGLIPWTNDTYAIDLKEALASFFNFGRRGGGEVLPRFHFSATVIKREVVERAIQRLGFVLLPDMPNIHSLHLLLFPFAKTCRFIDTPVVIVGRLGVSMSQIWSTAARNRFREKPFMPRLSPFTAYTRINGIIENYLRSKELLPDLLLPYSLDMEKAASLHLSELKYLDTDVKTSIKNWKNFFTFLRAQPVIAKKLKRKAVRYALVSPFLILFRRLKAHLVWRWLLGKKIRRKKIEYARHGIQGTKEFEFPIPQTYAVSTVETLRQKLPVILEQELGVKENEIENLF